MLLSDKRAKLKKILAEDNGYTVITADIREQLQDDMNTLENIVDKLVKKEFTVAIVGLENAGKSKLGNALIGFDIFPEKSDRCTYTTTMACSGGEYKGEVFFYTEKEFNIWFRNKLEKICFPEFANITFENFAATTLDSWFDRLSQEVQTEKRELKDEIETLLENREDVINKLRTTDPEELDLNDKNGKQQLDKYIKGANRAVTYAIEKIVVKSPQLAGMAPTEDENIILYDVPGFNSPANLHKTQTTRNAEKSRRCGFGYGYRKQRKFYRYSSYYILRYSQ